MPPPEVTRCLKCSFSRLLRGWEASAWSQVHLESARRNSEGGDLVGSAQIEESGILGVSLSDFGQA